jgi:hypothetical protein
MMMEPAKGKAAIRAALASFTDTAESVQFKVLASATVGNRVDAIGDARARLSQDSKYGPRTRL